MFAHDGGKGAYSALLLVKVVGVEGGEDVLDDDATGLIRRQNVFFEAFGFIFGFCE